MSDQRQGFTPPPRKKTALDNRKLNMSVPCPTAPGKTSALIWGLYSNNPRITVYTGDPEDSGERNGYGKLTANLDAPTFFVFLELVKKAIGEQPGWKMKIENKGFTWFGGKRSDAPAVISELWVGKNADGRIWLSITMPNRPKIQFFFNAPDFHSLCNGDGTPLTGSEVSILYANAYIKNLGEMMSTMLVTEWTEPPPPKDKQGGGGGQRQGGGNNYGGGQRQAPARAEEVGEDIPF